MTFTIELATVSDREAVVAEIWWGTGMVAELRRDGNGSTLIEIYRPKIDEPWCFDLASWVAALARAEHFLIQQAVNH